MAFSKKVRDEVKRAARFRCCRCHEIGVEVHHIVPQEDEGSDSLDNAAPLCPNCHTWFGDNPKKRSEIRDMRDLWYEIAQEKWPTARDRDARLNDAVVDPDGARGAQELAVLLDELRAQVDRLRNDPEPSRMELRDAAASLDTATRLGSNVYANFRCRNCGTSVGLLIGGNSCPNCGAPID